MLHLRRLDRMATLPECDVGGLGHRCSGSDLTAFRKLSNK